MKAVIVAGSLLASLALAGSSPTRAGEEPWVLLTPNQTRAYHACLFEAWIEDYCHEESRTYHQCVIANGGGRYPLEDRAFSEKYCWNAAHQLPPR